MIADTLDTKDQGALSSLGLPSQLKGKLSDFSLVRDTSLSLSLSLDSSWIFGPIEKRVEESPRDATNVFRSPEETIQAVGL